LKKWSLAWISGFLADGFRFRFGFFDGFPRLLLGQAGPLSRYLAL